MATKTTKATKKAVKATKTVKAVKETKAPERRVKSPIIWTVKTSKKGHDIYMANGQAVFLIENPRNRTGKVSIYIHKRLNSTLGEANRPTSQYSRRLRGPKDEVFHIVDQAARTWAEANLVEYIEA